MFFRMLCIIGLGFAYGCFGLYSAVSQETATSGTVSAEGDIVATPAECFAELIYVRGLLAEAREFCLLPQPSPQVSSHLDPRAATSVPGTALISDAMDYRDDLLDAMEVMPVSAELQAGPEGPSHEQTPGPVSEEMILAMKNRLGNDSLSEEVIRIAPPLAAPALDAWRRMSDRMGEMNALREATEGFSPEIQAAAVQMLDRANRMEETADQLLIEQGIGSLDRLSEAASPGQIPDELSGK